MGSDTKRIGCGCLTVGMGVFDLGLALLTLLSFAITDASIVTSLLGGLLFGINAVLLLVVGAPILRDGLRERGFAMGGKVDDDDKEEEGDEEDEDEEGN